MKTAVAALILPLALLSVTAGPADAAGPVTSRDTSWGCNGC